MYALDRANGVLPIDIFKFMIQKGADITQRDSVRFSLTLFFMFVFYYIFQYVICIKVSLFYVYVWTHVWSGY